MAACFQGGSVILKPLSWYKDLHTLKGRSAAGAFLVEGTRAVNQLLQARPSSVLELLACEDNAAGPAGRVAVRRISPSQLRSISTVQNPAGPIAVIALPGDVYARDVPKQKGKKILVLEDIQDPGNVGTLLRTAAAFDFSGVLLSDKCADPFSPKVVQATAGSVLSLWLRKTEAYCALVASCKDEGYCCIAADVRGAESLPRIKMGKCLMMLGNEGNGLSRDAMGLADHVMRIPINQSKAQSLNVAVSGAIGMYVVTVLQRDAGAAVPL